MQKSLTSTGTGLGRTAAMGKIQESFKDGKRDGPWVEYRDNGRIKEKGTFEDGKTGGPWVSYNKGRTVDESLIGTFKNGVKVK